jgi:UDP-glucose 4-epimerase
MVTGGAGYIGSHTVRQLVDVGHSVVVYDNLSKGHREAVSSKADLVVGDIQDAAKVEAVLREQGIEAVLHFAAFIEVAESVARPDLYLANNFQGSLSLLEGMKRAAVQKLVFSSTAAVYGDPLHVPVSEGHPLAPINPYGQSKVLAEQAIEKACERGDIEAVVLRYFNVAGAAPDGSIGEDHEPESHLIPRLLQAALEGGASAQIYGIDYPTPDGTCVRDYVHVDDLAQAHLLALNAVAPGRCQIFNVGSEAGFSVREVLAACQKVTGKTFPIEEKGRRPGDPPVLIARSEKLRRRLGWRQAYPSIETMIEHAWKWHSKRHREPNKGFKG